MESPGAVGRRRRGNSRSNAEDQALDQIAREAESRLAQRRQARADAREIRMRQLERQQKEQEQNAARVFDMQASSKIDPLGRSRLAISSVTGPIRGNSMSSRRSSEDSLEE
ncbi:hypothetical protein HA402_005450 [Bradysia odoriphaga]|nr:hypothetical protein HA402_005450 [Bradysia odoriphaga]